MNRASLIFLGIFFTLAFSWTGIVLTNHVSYGSLAPVVDDSDGKVYPQVIPGIAARGKLVYQDLGCVYCHTQQVRQTGFGADEKRGWGQRPSYARDYIREDRVLIGANRTGPDLRNVGSRHADQAGREWLIKHLYDPQLTSPGSIMPPYRFLFETRKIVGEPSSKAVQKLLPGDYQPAANHEIVLTARGEALVEYLQSLHDTFNYPEEASKAYVEPKKDEPKKEEGHK